MVIDKTLKIILATILAFGFWYLIFWFVTAESNPLLWSGLSKTVYLFFGLMMFAKLEDEFGQINTSNKLKETEENEN